MMSSSPLISGPDWQSFAAAHNNPNGNSSGVSSTLHAQDSLTIPSTSSPPPSAASRPWGPNSLGGEALSVRSSEARRGSNITDPIGSRPGSRSDAPSPSPDGSNAAAARLNGKRQSQRPSANAAMAVAAAASSAAARSRATSPANFNSSDGYGVMGLGTTFHPNARQQASLRIARSSSPSYINARANTENMDSSGAISKNFFPDAQGIGTPTLVVDEPESADLGSRGGEKVFAPSSDPPVSTAGRSSVNDLTEQMNGAGVHRAAPQPLRSDTQNSSSSNFGLGGGQGFASLPGAGASSSSLHQHGGGLLSPSAAAAASSGAFPISSPTSSGLPFFLGQNSHNGADVSSPTVGINGGMQSFAAFNDDRSALTSPGIDVFQPMGMGISMGNHATTSASPDFEAQLGASRLVQDLTERLTRVESSVRDLNRSVAGLNRNVTILLDRTKHLAGPTSSQHHSQRGMNAAAASASPHYGQAGLEEVRALSAQVSLLTNSMSQLMGQGNTPASGMPGSLSAMGTPLAGLGLGSSTPHLGNGSTVNTPQLGTFPGTPAFMNGSRFGAMSATAPSVAGTNGTDPGLRISTPSGLGQMHGDRNSRLSPRPGASPGPQNNRRWSSMMPGTPDAGNQQQQMQQQQQQQSQQTPLGAMIPPEPSVIVTKWEHLNLHPDLLRSILKYGLGPPNKIQQRALPFLLRGSDIIAQAPPTQERIASYVIPVLQLVLNISRGEAILPPNMGVRGPIALFISTTVDQATQAQRMAMGLGAALGIRVHIATTSSLDVAQEASALIQTQPQIVVGTPQKMMDLFNFLANNTKGAISLADVRCVVLDEVDQLIARNLADHVSALLRILPTPRIVQYSNPAAVAAQRNGFGPLSPGIASNPGFSAGTGSGSNGGASDVNAVTVTSTDRQTAIFSNTVPQDVLNFAQSIHLRESVRVLVRREGGGGTTGGSVAGTANGGAMTSASSQHNGNGQFGTNGSALQSANPHGSASGGASSGFGMHGANVGHSSMTSTQPPINTLGASPANNHANPMSDPILSSLRGLRQYYLYVAVTTGGGAHSPNPASGGNGSQVAHAMEMKLDVITDLLEDIDFGHAVVYTSTSAAHEAVTYKLASKGIEALGLHRDMASTTRQQVLAKYRSSSSTISSGGANYHAAGHTIVGGTSGASGDAAAAAALQHSGMPTAKKALVVYDVVVQPKDVHQVPLIVFYDLPRSVDEYKEKIACAASGAANSRPSVCVNVVTGSGGPRGDIEMLRTLECHLGCKMAELPMNSSSILHF